MKMCCLRDLIVITVLISTCFAVIFILNATNTRGDNTAFVYYYNQLLAEIDLSLGEGIFSFSEAENVVIRTDSGGNIYFYYSDCPDKVCMRTGKLNRAGQSAACLPNGIIIRIRGTSDSREHDVIVQ
ncbi:MAG: NusG domain II-containing protein [Defluviitaleaceae bacterium]|nr:NusG domain II-containing protein [Defluviitaleaceae bacterium]